MLLRAFLTYSIAYGLPSPISSFLGILGPFPFLGHPRSILITHSHGLLLTILDFSDPIFISFTFGVHELSINPLLTYFITSGLLWPILTFYTVHEFITSFFGLLFLLSLRPIYYFLGLWSIIPVIRVLWFSSQFTNSFPLILLGFFLLLGLFAKVSINTLQSEGQARQRP